MPRHICNLCRLREVMQGRLQALFLLLFLSFALVRGQALAAEAEVQYIDAAALKGMLGDPNLVIIDTSRGWWTYDQKIVGSLIFPEEASSWAARIPKDKRIVLYCGWPLDFDSVRAARELMEMGYPKVLVLKGGYGAWKRAGYPLEPKNYKK